ncbi:hypothetical protein FQZ97_686550 [compost metagenome]
MTACGVPFGAANPNHPEVTNPGSPASCAVGTPGSDSLRSRVVTNSARTLPACTFATCAAALSIMASMWPPSRSAMAPVPPL